ncbi:MULTISPECIES: hypothetical protein [Caldisericum]|jgi:hypothetical protein|uniref:Uncharacterized protein n=1 Tax=Caldisericum exile TaxID=693075 RepID=A0A2J6WFZ8_9BACT|nr:MAG: hypothetical protein C0189_00390 [Caldisericum exile]PMP81922.1 MAG: hypothetical protein C0175_04570 [Caldisericum exile]HEM56142.1 hypothetical protein [Thermodesulfobium narugense]
MKIKTLNGALMFAKNVIKKYFGESVLKVVPIEKNAAILETKYSLFLLYFVEDVDKSFRQAFPEIARQIMWDEGIKISKKVILDFLNKPNPEHKKLSVLIVLPTRDMYQISPSSLVNFCELARLEVEDNGVYYFFPTIFLKKIEGNITQKETRTKNKLSLISQINSLDDFDSEDLEQTASFKDFDVDFLGEIVRSLRSIEERLESIEKLLKERNGYGRKNS